MQEELTRLQIEQEEYADELESIRDMARDEGLAAGREEGREEVLREKAIRMYDKDYPIPEIADVLDLSEADVQRYVNGFQCDHIVPASIAWVIMIGEEYPDYF